MLLKVTKEAVCRKIQEITKEYVNRLVLGPVEEMDTLSSKCERIETKMYE